MFIFLIITFYDNKYNIHVVRSELKRFFLPTAPTMFLSKQRGHAVSVESTNTIAAGLAPPYAGEILFIWLSLIFPYLIKFP